MTWGEEHPSGAVLGRRTVLAAAVGGGVALLGGFGVQRLRGAASHTTAPGGHIGPAVSIDASAAARVEAARARSGRTTAVDLVARRSTVDLGGTTVEALTYGGELPGPTVRLRAGDLARVSISNQLDGETSVHWHGLALRHDADGVPGVTGPAIAAGSRTEVSFVVPDPGTYWLHPHTGMQLDWGLSAPVIIDDPQEPGRYDSELVVMLDDWTVGLGKTPEQLFADLTADGGSMSGMGGMGGMGHGGGMNDAGDVAYPAYLANGRLPTAPRSVAARPGDRVRIRLINAAADTTFDVALGGHRLTVTHTDGFPVIPVTVDTLQIAMGERYDVTVTLADGVFPLTALPTGKSGTAARVLIRTASGGAPAPGWRPGELTGRRLTLGDLVAADAVRWPDRTPDTEQAVALAGTMGGGYRWTINGTTYADAEPLTVREGQLTRLRITNRSMMLHPVHLHGHTFAVRGVPGSPRKDTVVVPAMAGLDVEVRADNPGAWMLHCHNMFHMEAGMMTRLDYA
ncbi:MAG: multicopper oxidase family protein [Kineosporiaceae bacterium]|nr:multicopper oxidase family protein [Kineosporiaceae bacterium]MBK7624236.1 multicopper oxidase family protein [Kineosporiaceae bacterium]MBK8075290.1 multicopper oxidase family protein [Kineosporiaceae bacterium]